ncbi:peptide-methionine (S)-S-oxide reductase [Pseudohongiella acticola]|uniref:Peptide methionine sulfoxide reductase MsrA n=1 Tax=Pseudohongiella acticola TaxID=1524254 RepID=A0A1E8CFY8_9GAMM|nr:peptide-methionine (S)-S-oxide reductase MsrA [Pseudohongiella acticola]OFE11323.1 peptide-methionine (S)-S-oxide reductase [Pseudohongiella acticola]
MGLFDKDRMISADRALRGRDSPMQISGQHVVTGNNMLQPLPAGLQEAVFALGCFWGAERVFWKLPGVYSTAVGYAGGFTPNPTYEEVCSGSTGHTEAVRVVFDPAVTSFAALLKTFWASHDPTQGMRQGNDRGTQYRSAIYTVSDEQKIQADASRAEAQKRLDAAGVGIVTTEIAPLADFYYAEEYHQQYLAKNPAGYCGIRGLSCLIE